MTEPPVCGCHGEAMVWAKDTRYRGGGYWRCRVQKRAYERSEKGRARQARYAATDKNRAAHARYNATEKGRAAIARYESQPHRRLAKQLHGMASVRVRY